MGNYGPPGQWYKQAEVVPAEVPQEATRRKGGLTMTSGKRLPNETPRNGAVTWYLLPILLVTFSYGFFDEGFGFCRQGHACVGTAVFWDSRQCLGSTGIYLRAYTLH